MRHYILTLIAIALPLLCACSSTDDENFGDFASDFGGQKANVTAFIVNTQAEAHTALEHKFAIVESAAQLDGLGLSESESAELAAHLKDGIDWARQSLVVTRFTNPFATETDINVYQNGDRYRFAVTFTGIFRSQAFWHALLVTVVDAKGLNAKSMSATIDDVDEGFKPVAW